LETRDSLYAVLADIKSTTENMNANQVFLTKQKKLVVPEKKAKKQNKQKQNLIISCAELRSAFQSKLGRLSRAPL
jgi:hypothetical protein